MLTVAEHYESLHFLLSIFDCTFHKVVALIGDNKTRTEGFLNWLKQHLLVVIAVVLTLLSGTSLPTMKKLLTKCVRWCRICSIRSQRSKYDNWGLSRQSSVATQNRVQPTKGSMTLCISKTLPAVLLLIRVVPHCLPTSTTGRWHNLWKICQTSSLWIRNSKIRASKWRTQEWILMGSQRSTLKGVAGSCRSQH